MFRRFFSNFIRSENSVNVNFLGGAYTISDVGLDQWSHWDIRWFCSSSFDKFNQWRSGTSYRDAHNFRVIIRQKNRAIRLLYSVLHGDKHFLSNSIRNLIRDKNIDDDWQQKQKLSSSSSIGQFTDSTTFVIEPQVQSQVNAASQSECTVEQNSPNVSQTSETKSSIDIPGFNLDMSVDADEWVTFS